MVLAIRRHPGINAHFDQETGMLTQFAAVHVGVATQTDAGLMVPVLHNAQDLGLQACAAAIHSLSERAREGTLERRLLTGSSITISSLGALGGIAATPIINHPEVAIVGVNRSRELPVVRKGQVLVRRMMNLSSSFDHRVVDGMDAARYIQEVRHLLEHPGLLFTETG